MTVSLQKTKKVAVIVMFLVAANASREGRVRRIGCGGSGESASRSSEVFPARAAGGLGVSGALSRDEGSGLHSQNANGLRSIKSRGRLRCAGTQVSLAPSSLQRDRLLRRS